MEPNRPTVAEMTWMATSGGEHAVLRSHAPVGTPKATAVLMVPPFGWEDMCSYRPRRAMALRLAAAGIPCSRLELPGTGDAEGGPWDPDRVGRWIAAVSDAAAYLRSRPGVDRVAAFGVGLGGLVAWEAAAAGAAIDDLALWGVPAEGRRLVRELKALSRLEVKLPGDDQLPAGALAAAGYVLSPETIAALQQVDLSRTPLPEAVGRRVLLFERDGLAPSTQLVAVATSSGADVEVTPGPGFGEMVKEPQWAEEPQVVAQRLVAWATAGSPPSSIPAPPAPAVQHELELEGAREAELVVDGPRGGLPVVVTEPAQEPMALRALLLNAGSQRHTGPNRMWVETARRWASRGVPTARVDLGGIGDAQTADIDHRDIGLYYTPDYLVEVRRTVDALDDGRPLVVAGLCSGAYWSLHAAVEDPRVVAVVLLNPRELLWSRSAFELKDARNLVRQMRDPESWRKVVRREVDVRRPFRLARAVLLHALPRLRRRPRATPPDADPLGPLLDRLPERGARLTLVFSGEEELATHLDGTGHFARLAAHPLVDVHVIGDPKTDTHTFRPPALQREVSALLDAALDAAAARVTPAGGSSTPRA